jgi:hypothetical protein
MPRKKVLIISHNALSMNLSNGKTLSAIFSSWSNQEIAQLYFQDEIPESNKYNNFYRLRDLDILKSFISNKDFKVVGCIIEPERVVEKYYNHWSITKRIIFGFLSKFSIIKIFIRDWMYGRDRWISDGLLRWISQFKPDSIFFVAGNSSFSFKVSRKLSFIYNIPLDIFITDDYIINNYPSNFLEFFLHRRLLDSYKEAITSARNVFVIGEDMALEYKNFFKRDFSTVMNAVNISSKIPKILNEKTEKAEIDIVYCGGLHSGRDLAISNFGNLLSQVKEITGHSISFHVYSSQVPCRKAKLLFKKYNIIYCGYLNPNKINNRLSLADFLLHVESFDKRNIRKTKLSISTKIPEYLASGSCIVAYGPSEVSSIRLIYNNSIGMAITELDDDSSAVKKLSNLVMSVDTRTELSISAYKFALNNFSLEVVRDKMSLYLNA